MWSLLAGLLMSKGSGSRSQWLLGLRYELCSPARTLGSWVRIPLEAWMSVSFCVYVGSGTAAGPIPRQRSPTDCLRIKKLK
jgi:hypothetical protein